MQTAYPPRYWFFSSDADKKQAEDEKAEQRLPRKLPREAYTLAMNSETVIQAMKQLENMTTRQRISVGTNDQRTAAVWEAIVIANIVIMASSKPPKPRLRHPESPVRHTAPA